MVDMIVEKEREYNNAESAKDISSFDTKNIKEITKFSSQKLKYNFTENKIKKSIKFLIKQGFLKETKTRYILTTKAKKLLKEYEKMRKLEKKRGFIF